MSDFTGSDAGADRLDGICMILIAVGEAFRNIDRKMGGTLLAPYPKIEWSGVKGVRDVIPGGIKTTGRIVPAVRKRVQAIPRLLIDSLKL